MALPPLKRKAKPSATAPSPPSPPPDPDPACGVCAGYHRRNPGTLKCERHGLRVAGVIRTSEELLAEALEEIERLRGEVKEWEEAKASLAQDAVDADARLYELEERHGAALEDRTSLLRYHGLTEREWCSLGGAHPAHLE